MRYLRFNYSFCIAIEIILASLMAVFTVLHQSTIVSLLFLFSFIVAFAYSGLNINNERNNGLVLLLIAICFINVTIDGFIENGQLNFNYYKKVLMFSAFCLLLYFATEKGWSLSRRVVGMIEILPVLAGIFSIFSYYYLGNTQTIAQGITLGFSNPNFAGMWLLHFFLYDCLFIFQGFIGKSKCRLFCIPIAVITLIMIDATRARSCLIAVIVFFVVILFGLFEKRVNKIVVFGVVLLPIIYAVIYLQVVDSTWFNEWFDFMISEGKTLDARAGIWEYGFQSFLKHPILGSYSGISRGTGVSQLHNTHVDVLASYGLIPFILFCKLLYISIIQETKVKRGFSQYLAYCSFISVLVMGSFEATVVAGSMGLNLLTIGFVALMHCEEY